MKGVLLAQALAGPVTLGSQSFCLSAQPDWPTETGEPTSQNFTLADNNAFWGFVLKMGREHSLEL
jgi:hypothetical protein